MTRIEIEEAAKFAKYLFPGPVGEFLHNELSSVAYIGVHAQTKLVNDLVIDLRARYSDKESAFHESYSNR